MVVHQFYDASEHGLGGSDYYSHPIYFHLKVKWPWPPEFSGLLTGKACVEMADFRG